MGRRGRACFLVSFVFRMGWGRDTLFGRYDAIEAVKTMEPLIPSRMKARAAILAV